MRRRSRFRVGTGLILVSVSAGCLLAAAPLLKTTTARDRKELSITVYGDGAAVVRDTRQVELPEGSVNLEFAGVSPELLPDSVRVQPVSAPGELDVLGQTYANNLLTPERLLQAYVGKMLSLVLMSPIGEPGAGPRVEATLLAANPEPVWQIAGKIETGIRVDHYVFPAIPSSLTATPSLILNLENRDAGEQRIRVSYFANNLYWSANYAIEVKPDWNRANLSARATINNRAGTDYDHAELQLVAGEVRRINEGVGYGVGVGGGVGGAMFNGTTGRVFAAPAPPPSEPFYGYHLYTFRQPLDLPNNAIKTVPLFQSSGLRISRSYVVTGQVYYSEGVEPSEMLNTPVQLRLKFDNTKANSLGDPLPAGVVRVYKADRTGRDQLIGEDRLLDTAPGETVTLNLGNAFDVVERGKETDYKKIGPNAAEEAYEITIRNHQSQAVVVMVNEPFTGDWQILSSTLPYQRTSSSSARFAVPVPANGSTVLRYRVRVQWAR
jgi:hypothetical protein